MPQIGIADKQTLDNTKTVADTINTKVGTNADVAGTTTVFARVRQIYEYLAGTILAAINGRQASWGAVAGTKTNIDNTATTVGTVNTNVNTVNTKIGVSTDTSATASLFGRLKQIWDKVSIIETSDTVLVPSNTVRFSFPTEHISSAEVLRYMVVGTMTFPKDGLVKIQSEMYRTGSTTANLFLWGSYFSASTSDFEREFYGLSQESGGMMSYPLPVGTVVNSMPALIMANKTFSVLSQNGTTNTWILRENGFFVKKGALYMLILGRNSTSQGNCGVRNIKIMYDEQQL